MNVGVSNTCVMSCLLPVIEKWSLEIGHHKALFLMPISFLLLISGVFAIFSTSTNLVVQGQLRLNNREPFDMFALAPAVTACTAASLVYLIVVPPFVLRRFKDTASDDESGSKVRLQRGINRFNARVQVMGQALADRHCRRLASWRYCKVACLTYAVANATGPCNRFTRILSWPWTTVWTFARARTPFTSCSENLDCC